MIRMIHTYTLLALLLLTRLELNLGSLEEYAIHTVHSIGFQQTVVKEALADEHHPRQSKPQTVILVRTYRR